jgi:hypothetical protein
MAVIINPYDDKAETLFEFTDDTDLDLVEDYFCRSEDGSRIQNVVLIAVPDSKEKMERFEQFCKVKRLRLFKDYINHITECGGLYVSGKDCEEYDKCFVSQHQRVIDKDLNLHVCMVLKNTGHDPITNVKEYVSDQEKIEKLIKDDRLEDAAKIVDKIQKRTEPELMKCFKKEHKECKESCYQNYINYNRFIMQFNRMNEKFRIW